MTDPTSGPSSAQDPGEISVLALATVIVRWRTTIIVLALVGGILGLASGLTKTRLFKSQAVFIPQGSEGSVSGIAAAASQLGIRVPTGSTGAWGPTIYVEVARSPALLESIAHDTVTIAEQNGRRQAVVDVLEVGGSTPALRAAAAVEKLQAIIHTDEVKTLGAVRIAASTAWPSVSYALVKDVVKGVNDFNFKTRKSQAASERQFVETQAAEAQSALLIAEDALKSFLNRNRVVFSPDLVFQKEHLEREVALRQQLYTSYMQSREEARIREVRDTPVITILEEPRVPVVGEPRNSVQKAIIGGFLGAFLGIALALLGHWRAGASRNSDAAEFLKTVDDAIPRFLRRSAR